MTNRRFAESDWINTTMISQLDDRGAPAKREKEAKISVFEANLQFQHGVDVTEFDTIPAELKEFFK